MPSSITRGIVSRVNKHQSDISQTGAAGSQDPAPTRIAQKSAANRLQDPACTRIAPKSAAKRDDRQRGHACVKKTIGKKSRHDKTIGNKSPRKRQPNSRVSLPEPTHKFDNQIRDAQSDPAGPEDFHALMNDSIPAQRARISNLLHEGITFLDGLLSTGLDVVTFMSGTGAAEMALRGITQAAASDDASTLGTEAASHWCAEPMIKFHSTCDTNPVCRRVCENHPKDTRAAHSFGDILECVPPPVLKRLKDGLSSARDAYRRRAEQIGGEDHAKLRELRVRLGKKWAGRATTILEDWTPQRDHLKSKCYRHNDMCPTFPAAESRFLLIVAGVCCQPWSRKGKQMGWLDDRCLPTLVLARMLKAIGVDGACIECTPFFDFDTFHGILQSHFIGNSKATNPALEGKPVRRARLYMWFESKRRLVDTLHPGWKMYELVSHRTLSLPWTVYLRATPEEIQAHYQELLSGKSHNQPVLPRVVGLSDVLSEGNMKRLDAFLTSLQASPAQHNDVAVDISANVRWAGLNLKPYLATLTCSTCLVFVPRAGSSEAVRLILPSELPAIHGISFPQDLGAQIKPVQMRSLIGNSMHVAQVGCFLQFAFASSRRRIGEGY